VRFRFSPGSTSRTEQLRELDEARISISVSARRLHKSRTRLDARPFRASTLSSLLPPSLPVPRHISARRHTRFSALTANPRDEIREAHENAAGCAYAGIAPYHCRASACVLKAKNSRVIRKGLCNPREIPNFLAPDPITRFPFQPHYAALQDPCCCLMTLERRPRITTLATSRLI